MSKNTLKAMGGLAIFGFLGLAIVGVNKCKNQNQDPHVVPVPTTIKITNQSPNLVLAAAAPYAQYHNGKPQTLTIQNVGLNDALIVDSNLLSVIDLAVKGHVKVEHNCPPSLAPKATCSFTFYPTVELKTTKFKIHGLNTNQLDATITVLDYGSQYQGGYVYALTPYVFGNEPDKNMCDPNTLEGCSKVISSLDVGLTEWAPSRLGVLGAKDLYNGRKNTSVILKKTENQNSAARACQTFSAGGYKDWYLPAICELGNDGKVNCMKSQNVFDSLKNLSDSIGILSGEYWSSTEFSESAAWRQDYAVQMSDPQNFYAKTWQKKLKCARVITR